MIMFGSSLEGVKGKEGKRKRDRSGGANLTMKEGSVDCDKGWAYPSRTLWR